jgi:hypothetical protein
MTVSENEKMLIQKEIFIHLAGGFDNRAIRLLVLIDNIDNPRCRRDIVSQLHNNNIASIKTFERITGIKLAKTNKERKAQLETISKTEYSEPKHYKPRKVAVKTEYNDTFYIFRRAENGFEYVECKGKLWRYNNMDFFVQKCEEKHYKATEGKTGLSVASGCKTLSELKKAITEKMSKKGVDAVIERHLEEYGISPMFEAQ